ncbi:MAG: serine hydrolase domain-containing protein [Victivallaceae bacterium]|nr:serine hydrolase domain-containing protein [Victivallaceae bacterium]
MRGLCSALGLLLLPWAAFASLEDRRAELQPRLEAAFNDIFKDVNPPDEVGIFCYLVRGGESMMLEYRLSGVTADTSFRIASGTKMFTACAVAKLILDGKLDLEGPVTRYIPENYLIPDRDKITLHMLLNHKSGIFDPTNADIPENLKLPFSGRDYTDYIQESDPDHTFTCDEYFALISKYQLQEGPPGGSYYCNMNYALLTEIIGRAAGTGATEFIAANTIVPAGMEHTFIPENGGDRALPAPFLHGYAWTDRAAGKVRDATGRNPSVFIGSGNIVSTPRDMTRFVKWLLHTPMGQIMKPPPEEGYGLGMMRKGSGYGNDGAFNGYYSIMFYNEELDLAWCIVINLCDFSGDFGFQVNRMTQFQDEMVKIVGDADRK